MLTLTLEKAGAEPPKKLQLSLNKGARFTVKISWKCNAAHEDDVDIHALEASNTGNGATVTALESVLSTYNTKKMNPRAGVLVNKPDGSFSTPSGGLTHSGDIRVQGSFETITVDGTYLPDGVNEIPLFATVHRANHGSEHETPEHDSDEEAAFADIEVCIVTISDSDGRELQSYQLSDEFGDFNVVQMGSVLLGENGWEYAPVGRGFTGTINDVLAHFS
ncbi:TerD family protein [Agrobacterium tumefaciens]|uniref:TerD family protein n=1 Tax=Agrobacterium tumefaciens TaxID=358 RepID=UPI0007133F2C|nr:stress protein [Rhizobium sp. Root564]NTC84148.1 TerD family protein [Agrobacterium tumefaciens]NTD11673.1 TerD family protein [Agrobacterium tumefaciens]